MRIVLECALLPLIVVASAACSGAVGDLPSTDMASPEVGTDAALIDVSTVDHTVEATSPDAGVSEGAAVDVGSSVDVAPAMPSACAGYAVCDDFEETPLNGPPSPVLWPPTPPASCSTGVTTVSIDDQESHSGHHSVKVVGGGNYCDHGFFVNTSAFTTIGLQVYARFFVFFGGTSDAVAPNGFGNDHVSFLVMTDSQDNDLHLRMGGWNQVLAWNRESDMATLPLGLPGGLPEGGAASLSPAAQAWTCVEFHVDETAGTIDTWVNGSEVPGLVEDGAPDDPATPTWQRQNPAWRPSLKDFQLGWESYNGATSTLWFDDVIIDSHRVGCDVDGGTGVGD